MVRTSQALAAAWVMATAAALAPAALQAQETVLDASASLTNLQFGVIDLTPEDGVYATYRLANDAYTRIDNDLTVSNGAWHPEALNLPGWRTPGSTSFAEGGSSSGASLSATQLSASGHLSGVTWSEFTANARTASSITNFHSSLLLAPHTMLAISADYLLSVSLAAPSVCSFDDACSWVSASAGFYAQGGLLDQADLRHTISLDNTVLASLSQQASGQLLLTLTNDSDRWRGEYLDLSASVMGFVAQPVPEPGSWALMGVGLLGLGAARRRAPRA